jgi:hypothetical protein
MDNLETLATLPHKTQDEDKQNKKHNIEKKKDEELGPQQKPGVNPGGPEG